MGHYYSEMYFDDRSDKQKEDDAKKEKRKKEIEARLCAVLKIKREELKIVKQILKEHAYLW